MSSPEEKLTIPENIRDFLFGERVYDVYDILEADFSLPEESFVQLANLVDKLLAQEVPLSDLPQALQKEFPNLSPESSQKLAVELLSGLFLDKPIKGFLPGVEEQIVAWGGVLPELSLDEKTEEVAKKFDGKLSTDAEKSRLRFLLKGFFAEERTEDVLLSFLSKAQKLGGLTVAPELALEIVSEAKNIMSVRQSELSESVKTVEEVVEPIEMTEEVAEPELSESVQENTEAEESSSLVEEKVEPEPSAVMEEVVEPEELSNEVAEVTPGQEAEPVLSFETESSNVIEEQVESEKPFAVVEEITKPEEPSDVVEVIPEPALEAPVEMEKIEAPEVLPMIGDQPHDLLTSNDHEELNNHAEKASNILANIDSNPVVDLEKHMADTFEKLAFLNLEGAALENMKKIASDRISGVQDPYTTRTRVGRPVAEGGVGLSGVDSANAMLAIEDGFSDHQAHVLAKMKEERKEELRSIREGRENLGVPNAQSAEKSEQKPSDNNGVEPTSLRMSGDSIPASTLPKPQVTDVRFVPRLTGPTEELRRMGIKEFRRIAKDPKKVIERILDKIDSLAETGYDKKIVGIKAWRESPINQLYLRMTQEALTTGVSIEAVSQSFASRGEEFLTPEEVRAIVHLNGSLRF